MTNDKAVITQYRDLAAEAFLASLVATNQAERTKLRQRAAYYSALADRDELESSKQNAK